MFEYNCFGDKVPDQKPPFWQSEENGRSWYRTLGERTRALEGMSEALAGEIGPLGIRVTIVEPGPFRTDFAGRSMEFADPITDYRDTPAGALRERFSAQDGVQPNDPARAVAAIIGAVNDERSPLRLPLGPEAVDRIRQKLRQQLADLERWEAVSIDTRYRTV